MQQYQQRITDLETIAAQEDITISASSLEDFRTFLQDLPSLPRAGLILTDQGNLVAIWTDAQHTAVEVEFSGNQECKLIAFPKPTGPLQPLPEISTGTLRATADRIKSLPIIRQDD